MPRTTLNRTIAVVALGLAGMALSACGGAQARKAKHLEKGQTYLAAGNYEKARVEFQNALQIAPVDPEARFENGVVDEKLGKVREAAQFYQGTIDVSPDHLGARTNLSRIFLFGGVPDKTLELIGPALDKHPDDSELLTLRAAARVQKDQLIEAQADAERAVQLDPKNEDAVSALAGIYVSTKAIDKALTLLEDAIKRIPSTVDLRLSLAHVYAGENRPTETERLLLEVVGLRPTDKSNRIRLAQFYGHQNQLDAAERVLRDAIKTLPQDRDLKLSLVDFLSVRRSPEVAEKELLGMIASDPKDFELKFALARFYVAGKQSERAEKIYREVIDAEKLDAAGIAARDHLAGLLAARNDIKGTEGLIGEVLAKSPRDTDALILRADIALTKNDPKTAIADLRTVLRDQPNSIGVLRTLARAHVANGEPAIAEETMRRALEANPKDATLRLDLAQLLAQLNKPAQSKAILADLVKEQPNNIQALDSLFRVSATMKDYDTAKSAAEGLVAAQPKAPVGYMYEGILAEEAKHNDEALRLYGQAAALQPDALEPLQAEIRLLVALKRVPEALKRLDESTAKDPKNASPPNIKGDVLLTQKDFEGAQGAFKIAIERAPAWFPPYRGLAAAQAAAKDTDAALATLRKAESAVAQPDLVGIEIASYLEKIGKPEDAILEYDAIIRRNPQSDVAANNLAMLLVTYGKDAASLDRAKSLSARFADSSNPSFLDTYGWVLFKHGEASASVPVLQRVVLKSPDAPVLLYHLGMAQSQSGSTAQALDNLTRAVNSGAKFSGLDEAKATLNKLATLPSGATPKT
jgi:tetratricopeptide (TPR) repeat protein